MSVFIFCSDFFTLQLIVICDRFGRKIIDIIDRAIDAYKVYLIINTDQILRITDDIFHNSFLNDSIFVIIF